MPVSLKPLTNIHSQISPRIFEKIWNGPKGILRGSGDTDLWKKSDVENLVSDSLEGMYEYRQFLIEKTSVLTVKEQIYVKISQFQEAHIYATA